MVAGAIEAECRQCIDLGVDIADALVQHIEQLERRRLAPPEPAHARIRGLPHQSLISQWRRCRRFVLLDALEHFAAWWQRKRRILQMTPAEAPHWRQLSREELDRGLNNGEAVAGSAEIIAGWDRRSAELRRQ